MSTGSAPQKRLRPYKLYLKNFRKFKDVEITLGSVLTVISGQNGSGKSNLVSLIASGSGLSRKSVFGATFQPEFYDYFNIDSQETFSEYQIYLGYEDVSKPGEIAVEKRLSFKDDSDQGRGIRIIPRATNKFREDITVQQAREKDKTEYGVGGDARIATPTIYLSLSRLYPLGEQKSTVDIKSISKKNQLYTKEAYLKYRDWYNSVIPNSIIENNEITIINKKNSPRSSLHMKLLETPPLSQSIGQDNVGNIISAFVDIYLLSLESNYTGALLCIDEVDVSLHPDTQIRLLNLMYQLAQELNIQFIVSTHSLTIIKEILKKESKEIDAFSVVYLKNPSLPHVSEKKSYEMLKADLFNKATYKPPKPKMYFEDKEALCLFKMLVSAYNTIRERLDKHERHDIMHCTDSNILEIQKARIIDEFIKLNDFSSILDRCETIIAGLGCEELFGLIKADKYFERIIILLDGDARIKQVDNKPKVSMYLDQDFSAPGLNTRDHKPTMCFMPSYFAPESYLFRIVYKLTMNQEIHMSFWRALDEHETTALYTADKVKEWIDCLPSDFTNDDVKGNHWKDIYDFIRNTELLSYYYTDYSTMPELIEFIKSVQKAYSIAYPLTISNRYS